MHNSTRLIRLIRRKEVLSKALLSSKTDVLLLEFLLPYVVIFKLQVLDHFPERKNSVLLSQHLYRALGLLLGAKLVLR